MVITDKLVFLQLQKTGCTHIETLLIQMFAAERFGKHQRIPRGFALRSRAILGTVRNPWDWYVSLWTFSCRAEGGAYRRSTGGKSLWRALRDPRTARALRGHRRIGAALRGASRELIRPADTWHRLQSNADDVRQFRDWLRLSLDSKRRYDLFQDYGHSSISAFAGLLTYLYEFLYLNDSDILFKRGALPTVDALRAHDETQNILASTIRTERLEDDLVRALGHAGYDLSAEQVALVMNAKRTNASGRERHLSSYYDAETADLVAERERLIVEKYSFSPPSPGPSD